MLFIYKLYSYKYVRMPAWAHVCIYTYEYI